MWQAADWQAANWQASYWAEPEAVAATEAATEAAPVADDGSPANEVIVSFFRLL